MAGTTSREIYRNGWLRCIPYLPTDSLLAPKSHLENLFVSFCVHDNDGPWLEFYDNRHCSAEHKPVAKFSLNDCLHISPRLLSSGEDYFEFAVTLKDKVLRLATESQELTLDWVNTLNEKLREQGIFCPKENEYSVEPSRPPHPRQNMPLPPPPVDVELRRAGRFDIQDNLRSMIESRTTFMRQESTESNASSASSGVSSTVISNATPQRDPNSPLPAVPDPIYEPIFPTVTNLMRTESARSVPRQRQIITEDRGSKRHSYAGVLDSTAATRGSGSAQPPPQSANGTVVSADVRSVPTTHSLNSALTAEASQPSTSSSTGNTAARRTTPDEPKPFNIQLSCVTFAKRSPFLTSEAATCTTESPTSTDSQPSLMDGVVVHENAVNGNGSLTCANNCDTSRKHDQSSASLAEKMQQSTNRTARESTESGPVSLSALPETSFMSAPELPSRTRHSIAEPQPLSPKPARAPLRREVTNDSIRTNLSSQRAAQLRNSTVVPIPPQAESTSTITHVSAPSITTNNNNESLYVEISEPTNVAQRATNVPLREAQILRLQKEIAHDAGVVLTFAKRDVHGSLGLVDVNGAVYIAGWSKPQLRTMLHVGDRLINICGRRVANAHEAQKTIKTVAINQSVEFVIQRVPYGKALAMKRSFDGENLGFMMECGTNEVSRVLEGGLAQKHGLSLKTPTVMDGGLALTSWFVTEVNNRPINLFYKNGEIEPRLRAVGKDISVLVQPADFAKALRKQLKCMWTYKNYIAH